MNSQNESNLSDLLSALYRRKLVVLAVFVITTGIVFAGVRLLPSAFTANATLIVKFGREFFYRPEAGNLESFRSFDLKEMVNAEVEILRSRDLAQQVVSELGAENLYPDLVEKESDADVAIAKAVATFRDSVSVNAVFDSSIIRLSCEHTDPELAARALNTLVEKFKDKHLEIFGGSSSEFLEVQLDSYRQNLGDAELALQTYKQEHGIFDLAAQKGAILRQRVQMLAELREARFRISELEAELRVIEADTEESTGTLPHPALSQQRAALVSKRADLTSLLRDADSKVAELNRQLARFQAQRQTSDTTVPAQPGVEKFRSLDEARIRVLDLTLKYLELSPKFSKESREAKSVRKQHLAAKKTLTGLGQYVSEVLETGIRDELSEVGTKRTTIGEQIAQIESELRSLAVLERSLQIRSITTGLPPLRTKRDTLVAEIAALEERLSALTATEKTLRALEREVTVNEQSFHMYTEKYEQARRNEKLDKEKVVNLQLIEKAVPPVSPTGLPGTTKIALGAIAGLLCGIAAAFFLELLKR